MIFVQSIANPRACDRTTMADPSAVLLSPGSTELHTVLQRLCESPGENQLIELFDLTAAAVHGWALAAAPDSECAATAVVAIYRHLWRYARRYPRQSQQPWAWLQVAAVEVIHQQRHHGWPDHH